MRSHSSLSCAALLALTALTSAQVRPDAVMLRDPDVGTTEIVFRYAGDLWLVPKEGGVARRLTTADGNEALPRFSPDGARVAFMGSYDGGTDLYVLDVAAGAPARVTFHPGTEVLSDWTPDGAALLYSSSEIAGLQRAPNILRVDAAGGQPEPLPVPYGSFAALDASGRRIAFTPFGTEFRTWKRYRGGHAADVWIYDLETGAARNLTADDANDEFPMWHGNEVVFRSDRGPRGVFNLWSIDVETGAARQLTFFEEIDVKLPSIGPSDVVFENGGSLYVLDLAAPDRPYRPIDVVIPGERPQLRPRAHTVRELMENVSTGPGGVRAAVEARGDVWSVPYEEGVTRNLTATSGVAERSPAWSPDGKLVAYFSDRSGEYELTLRRADQKPLEGADEHGEKRLTTMGPGWKYSISWSPDSKRILIGTSLGAMLLVDVASGQLTPLHENPEGFPVNASWSPDSRWLAWSHRHPESRLAAIFLHDLSTGATHVATSGMFADENPVFDLSGDFLYFTSSRTFDPLYGDLDTTWVYANSGNVCYVPLTADVEDPFAPEDPQEAVEGEESEDDDAKKEEDAKKDDDAKKEKDAKKEADAQDEDEASADADDAAEEGDEKDAADEDDAPEPVEIDLEGFERRIRILPLPAGRYAGVLGAERKVVFLRLPAAGAQEDGEATLGFLDLDEDDEDARVKTILKGAIRSAEVVADGKKVAVRVGDDLGVVDLAPDQKLDPADLSGLIAVIDPRAEWRQVLTDAWRLYRDFFYDAGMHGIDWDAMLVRYSKALEDATSRDDVHWLIGEMMSELNVGHAYNDLPVDDVQRPPQGPPTGLLGCDWTLEGGAYKIARILDGEYDADARSPLAVVDARAGDYLLAVNGVPVDASRAVHAALRGTAGKPTALTLCAAPRADGSERTVVVEPIPDESRLRYRAWVRDQRKLVDEASGGRIGYVHVPDTGQGGQNELVRQFLGQMHKDALLIDERWNGGGQIPDRFIEMLDRRLLNRWAVRAGEDWNWPPVAHYGPKAMLINYAAGSGGDCFPYFFRQRGLGKLIGTRTWGGLVGISGNPRLIDGSEPTVPRFAFYELDGTWGVEGHGVDPDIAVVDDPSRRTDALDPQLRAGVEHLLEELKTWTSPLPRRPGPAVRTGAGITPEDK